AGARVEARQLRVRAGAVHRRAPAAAAAPVRRLAGRRPRDRCGLRLRTTPIGGIGALTPKRKMRALRSGLLEFTMRTMMNRCGGAAAAAAFALLFAQPALAQSAPVLKASQVTEDVLVDALAIDTPTQTVEGPTRGFRPATRTAAASPKSA